MPSPKQQAEWIHTLHTMPLPIRRYVARIIWFDLADSNAPLPFVNSMYALADPQRLDGDYEFTPLAFARAMRKMQLHPLQINMRLKTYLGYRRRLRTGEETTELHNHTTGYSHPAGSVLPLWGVLRVLD